MKPVLIVFIGGGLGAILRELFVEYTPIIWHDFPLAIFIANILAAFLLGLAAAKYASNKIGNNIYLFISTGVMGGLSTFSTFVYGAIILMTASLHGLVVAIIYLVLSLIIGYIALGLGHSLGRSK